MANENQDVTTAIRYILKKDSSLEGVRELIALHASYQDESSKSIIREQTESMFLRLPSSPSGTSQTTRTKVIEQLFNQEPTTSGEVDTQFYQEVGRLCRHIDSGELKQLLNPVKSEQNQTSMGADQKSNQQQDPNLVNTRKLCALSGLTAYFDDDNITAFGKLLDPNEVKMTSFVTVILIVATVLSYVLPIPDPLSASLGVVAVGKTVDAVYQGVRKQNFSKASELIGEAIGLGVSAGLVAFGVRFVTPITLGIGISIAGLAACNYGYNGLQSLANNSVYTINKLFIQAISLLFFIPAHVFKGGSYLIQKSAEFVKNLTKNLSQRITNKPNSVTNSAEEQQSLISKQSSFHKDTHKISKQSSFHEDTHKKSKGITVVAVKILSGVLGGIRLPFQVAINLMKVSTTVYYKDTRRVLCDVVTEHHNNITSDVDLHWHLKDNSTLASNTSFANLNTLVNTTAEHRVGLLQRGLAQLEESRRNKETPVSSPPVKENTIEKNFSHSSQNANNQDPKNKNSLNLSTIASKLAGLHSSKNRNRNNNP